ncbi:MAG: 3-dehydroquinate synthase [Planctomycetota bacterium]|nr:MAG: 3-dehydroquinate synthase [Planctomycetota bacterium]
MKWPVYTQGELARLLKNAVAELDPAPSSILVLIDQNLHQQLEPLVQSCLDPYGMPYRLIGFEAFERHKSLAHLEELARLAVRFGTDRASVILAIGGGVTSDLGGLLAAVLLRGIRWGAIPTSLLAMVDAALGGKTAVDLPEGKNLIGAFHQPDFILCDIDTLASLPHREWSCGLGELLKTALISGPEMLATLEQTDAQDLRQPSPFLLDLVAEAGQTKMRIVEEDPMESGIRKVLNLGHTFGHALETAAGHQDLAHGEAVGLGLLCACHLAEEMEVAEEALTRRVDALLRKLSLPRQYPGELPGPDRLRTLLLRDKKAESGRLDLVLPVKPGQCILLRKVDPVLAVTTLREVLA